MPAQTGHRVVPIEQADLDRVGAYLHRTLNTRVTPSAWVAALSPSWAGPRPNHGFMLLSPAGDVVGVNAAIYSTRVVRGEQRSFCNLAALCVDEDARPHTVRLVRAILRQPGFDFTDLSPSGNVVELDRRLGFQPIPTATTLLANHPRPPRGFRVVTDPDELAARLEGVEATIHADHRSAPAAHHLLLVRGAESCYVVFRKDRRKGLPLFASVLHVSRPEVFRAGLGAVTNHLLLRHRLTFTFVEHRVARVSALAGRDLPEHRAKMFKSADLVASDVDDLYSELTCVAW